MHRCVIFMACVAGVASGFHLTVASRTPRLPLKPLQRSPLFTPLATSSDENLPVPSLPKWDPTNWTPKRMHNSPLFRSAAILAALALAGVSTQSPIAKMSSQAAATLHLLSFGTWFGTMVYTTFVAGITMYKNLPRQTFGKLQSKLFPKYFSLCSITVLLQILTMPSIPALGSRATNALGTALAMTLLNQFYLEPKSTKVMFERYKMEEMPGAKESVKYKELAGSFGKLHGMSSLTNLIALCGAVAHGYYLASALVV